MNVSGNTGCRCSSLLLVLVQQLMTWSPSECASISVSHRIVRYRINHGNIPSCYRIDCKLAKLAFLARSSSTIVCTLIHQSLDTCHLALFALRIGLLTFSPFLGQRQYSVRARSVLLPRPFLILSLRTSDQPTTSLRFGFAAF